MNYISAATEGRWSPIIISKPDGDEAQKAKVCHDAALKQITDVLLSENLVVLTGLGASRCVKDKDGKQAAPTMGDLWEAAKKKADKNFDPIKAKVRYVTPSYGDSIEVLLSHCLMSEKLQPDKMVEGFIADTEKLIVEMCGFVDRAANLHVHETFLRQVGRRSTRLPRLRLFTTNYDLCFERAASNCRFIVTDGFSHLHPSEFDGTYFGYDLVRRDNNRETPDFIPNVFHLYKLHGSLDWGNDSGRISKSSKPAKPLIIYPRENKFALSYDQPFLEMMSRFQSALRAPNTGLLVIGFGFNDPHLAQPILAAIQSNVQLKSLIVSPSLQEATDSKNNKYNEVLGHISRLISERDWRLGMLGCSFEDFVPLLPDLVAATEDEEHQARLRKVGGRK
jgi:hypothetical protein